MPGSRPVQKVNGGGGGGEPELDALIIELLEALAEALEDPEILGAVPAKYRPLLKLAAKLIKALARVIA